MTQIITGLIDTATWEIIFATAFFFGLFFFILVILGSFGDDDTEGTGTEPEGDLIDIDGDGIADGFDLDGDGSIDIEFGSDMDFSADFDGEFIDIDGDGFADGLDLDGDGSIDVEFDTEFAVETDYDLDSDLSTDIDGEMESSGDPFDHVEVDAFDTEKQDDYVILESKYKMGEYATFGMFYGVTGWFYAASITDLQLLLAIAIGYLGMKAFAFFIANYAQTVIVPVKGVIKGDIAEVRYSVTPEKSGLVAIRRRDGVLATEMARGAFPHDHFTKGDRGYIWGKNEKGIYLITRGIIGQPDLKKPDTEKSPKKKALDTI